MVEKVAIKGFYGFLFRLITRDWRSFCKNQCKIWRMELKRNRGKSLGSFYEKIDGGERMSHRRILGRRAISGFTR